MVLGVLTAVGVTFIAGYVARGLIAGAPADHEDGRRVDQLQRRLKELEKNTLQLWLLVFLHIVSIIRVPYRLGEYLVCHKLFPLSKNLEYTLA